MDTFKKILNLIPDNWEDVLAKTSEFEGHLDTGQQWVHHHEGVVKVWIDQLFPLLKVDWETIQNWFEKTPVFQELEKVKVDIPAWTSVPEGFDWDNMDQRRVFLDEKSELLKEAIQGVTIHQKSGEKADLTLAVDQLRELIEVIALEVISTDSVQHKAQIMNHVRPKVYALAQTLTGFDLQRQSNKTNNPAFDTRLQALVSLPEKIAETQPDEMISDLPEELAKAVSTIHQVQHAMPVIQEQLQIVAPELSSILNYLGALEESTNQLKTHFPFISEAIQNLLSGGDWSDLNVEKLTAEIKTLFTTIQAFLVSSPLTLQLLNALGQVQQVLPIRWVGYTEDLTAEQKWSQWLEEAKSIFSIPEDIEERSSDQMLVWFRDKLAATVSWINHVELMGTTIDDLYQRTKSPIEQLISTDGADLSSAEGVTHFVLDKLKLILDWVSPKSEENSGSDKVTKDNNLVQAEDVGPGAKQSTVQSSKSLMSILVHGLRDSIEKGQLIWQFLKENDLRVRLEDQQEDFQPTALKPTSFQVNNGAVASEKAGALEDRGEGSNQETISNESGGQTQTDSSNKAEELISWEQVISNLLGDRDSGVISYLPEEKQDIAMQLKNETMLQELAADLKQMWEASGINENIQSWISDFKDKTDENIEEVPSVAELLLLLLEGLGDLYELLLLFIQKVVHLLLDLVVRLIDLLFAVMKAVKVPAEVKEILPQPIVETLLGKQDPNLICLLAAMPMVLLEGLLSVPLSEMREWMEAA